MSRKVFVIGVGMTKFEKPGRRKNFDYPDMAVESGTKALQDAGVRYDQIEQACVGYVYGDTCCGQRALYELGLTGIPIYNVNNACASGSSALLLGKQLIQGGIANCVMCLGFEKMYAGPLKSIFNDRTHPVEKHLQLMSETCGLENRPLTAQMFGNAGREHMAKYGTKSEHFAKIAWKNHKHSVNNPNSQFQDEYTLEQIEESPKIYDHLTKLQCCPTSDGSAAVILASQEFVEKHNLQKQAVEVLAMEMSTDTPSVFADRSCIQLVGYDMTKLAGDMVFAKAALDRNAVDVVELHDCFSINELLSYEALGLCKPGEGGIMVDRGDNTYGGKYVINPSGGLLSKGHPLGATGLAQCAELSWQLRGMADKRQVRSARIALQHNIGLGGAAVVALYKLGYPRHTRLQATPVSASNEDDFKCSEVFKVIKSTLEKDGANIVNNVKGIFCFKIQNKAGQTGVWFVDAKNGNGSVTFGGDLNPGVTLTTSDENLILLFAGKLNPKMAFFQGKLKLAGDFSLASKLKQLYVPAETSKL